MRPFVDFLLSLEAHLQVEQFRIKLYIFVNSSSFIHEMEDVNERKLTEYLDFQLQNQIC